MFFTGSFSFILQDPKAPPGVCINFFNSLLLSLLISISSSLSAPAIPFLPTNNFPKKDLFFDRASINPAAVALITGVTPPD